MDRQKEALRDIIVYLQGELAGGRDFVEYAETLERLISGYLRGLADDKKTIDAACRVIDRLKEVCDEVKSQ